jgi:hypothetical protein
VLRGEMECVSDKRRLRAKRSKERYSMRENIGNRKREKGRRRG